MSMSTDKLQPRMGPVTLIVRDLDRCVEYYMNVIGLRVRARMGTVVHLGAGAENLLVLEGNSDAPPAAHTTGLFHTAFLVPSRAALARHVRHLADSGALIDGMADHAVSEAIYLSDPEGNGIEIYRERPRQEWTWKDGSVHMVTDPLDAELLLQEADREGAKWSGVDAGTIIGHVHLRVSNLIAAEKFYCDILGFDVTTRSYRGALFISKNGYHHHLGLNTWRSYNAPPPAAGSAGLKQFVHRTDESEFDLIRDRAAASEVMIKETAQGFLLRDPFGIQIEITR